MPFPVAALVVNQSKQQTWQYVIIIIRAMQWRRGRALTKLFLSLLMLMSHLDCKRNVHHFDFRANSFCFSSSLCHSHTKIKGWLTNSQHNWFPREDDPISPQWDFVLCVWVEWECQLPGTPGIGCWHGYSNGLWAPLSGATQTKCKDEKLNRRWEGSDYEDKEERSAPRETSLHQLMRTET